jgi:acyl dehydratase
MKLGDKASVKRAYSAQDIADYTTLGGAAAQGDKVPGPLIGALFSYLLGVKLPGVGTNYLKQESTYVDDAKVGEELTAEVEITQLRLEKYLVDLKTTCTGADGRVICEGRALVYVRDVLGGIMK